MHSIRLEPGGKYVNLMSKPDYCPFCFNNIIPHLLLAYSPMGADRQIEVLMYCPNVHCKKSFIAYYDVIQGSSYQINSLMKGNLQTIKHTDIINKISSSFNVIYNQAFIAEQENLLEICGVGYRKALEFLIKDYCIMLNPTDEEQIKSNLLGSVINNYINNVNIKEVSKRATWLGNDETHYIRKWENKDLADLKTLIDLTLHWIEIEEKTKTVISSMAAKVK